MIVIIVIIIVTDVENFSAGWKLKGLAAAHPNQLTASS